MVGYNCRDLSLPEDGFLLCNFNKVDKIDPSSFSVWMGVRDATELHLLHSLPQSFKYISMYSYTCTYICTFTHPSSPY